ncbi:aminotransferase class I/II-fold pyridoxal phosphate-dependent enzyme [Leucobacter sp. M11]|uniref:aminotransferase class I/II-fold pyridoxal phosphate-dependent enzyme n=1 Tax=Leucobacter sp. M11 TaxID=2993565 RepID=UPI002D8096C2|nr:aminotransferase class I/II-fold pyridoxal phosphate-dependent enzyme [Leucobacter sp. M11]MEB4615486.1 aminotransferase class I/II-fold pyridoxal phosphate-dependent enzyme [Leucobacter sp. M11]
MSAITRQIRDGDLAPGQALPSIRRLAQLTGLSPGTCATALRTLAQRGLIVSGQGRRSTVAELSRLPGVSRGNAHPGLTDLSKIEPDAALLPDVAGYLTTDAYVASMYDATNVLPELERTMRERFARDGASGPLTITNGALDAIERVCQARLHPGDTVVVEDPCWSTLRTLLRVLGLDAIGVPVDDDGLDPIALAEALAGRRCAALILTPRGHNPTGASTSLPRRDALRAVLDRHPELLIIEDDHLAEITPGPYPGLTAGRQHFAVIRSFSKVIGPDLRVAACCMDPDTTDQVQMRQLLGPGWVSHVLQRIVARVLTDPVSLDRIDRAAAVYRERRDLLIDALAGADIAARGASGFTVFVPVAEEAEVTMGLAQRGWAVQAGGPYRFASEPFIRVCVSTLPPTEILRFARDLIAVLGPASRAALRTRR